ncbi:MAG: DUF945 family protein [Woeseiaceae bacterium]
MKRSIVGLLVVLALVVLISPGIVGRLAEKNLEQDVEWAGEDSSDFVVTTEKFDRGWFSSEGRHRVTLRPSQLQVAMDPGETMPALVIDTRIDHGLVPIGSMSQASGSLKPGLARMVSTLQVDDGSGKLHEIPGTIVSETSLGGVTTGQYLLEAGSRDNDGGTASWEGADLRFVADNGNRSLTLAGEIQPWSYQSAGNRADVGLLTIDARQSDSPFGFPVGQMKLAVESVLVSDAMGQINGFEGLFIDGSSVVDGSVLNAQTTMRLEKLAIPGVGDVAMAMDVTASDLDAASVGRISQALDRAQSSADPDATPGQLFGAVQKDLESLLAAGGEIRFDQLDVSLEQGTVRSKFGLSVAKSDGAFSWPGLILALKADADVSVPAELVEMSRQMDPQTDSFIQMGILQLSGNEYRMQAEFAGGLLTVNGLPMPLPIPGQ